MHGIQRPARTCILAASLLSGGCMSLIASKHSYSASSAPAKVNGADIRMQVRPEGTDGGSYAVSAMVVSTAVATFDGPFSWRLEALGKPGLHQSIEIHRIRTRTSVTKRDEWYPERYLDLRCDFKPQDGSPGQSRALYPIPGLLLVKPREDGALEVTVDLTVRTTARSERKQVRFRMEPSQGRRDEFIFIPTEIAESIGKPPGEWDDKGWD